MSKEKRPITAEGEFDLYAKVHKIGIIRTAYRLHRDGTIPSKKLAKEFQAYEKVPADSAEQLIAKMLFDDPVKTNKIYNLCWETVGKFVGENEIFQEDFKAKTAERYKAV